MNKATSPGSDSTVPSTLLVGGTVIFLDQVLGLGSQLTPYTIQPGPADKFRHICFFPERTAEPINTPTS